MPQLVWCRRTFNDASTFRAACDDITSERRDHKFRRKMAGPLDAAALYQIPEHNGPGRYFVEYRKIKRPFPPTAEYRKINLAMQEESQLKSLSQ